MKTTAEEHADALAQWFADYLARLARTIEAVERSLRRADGGHRPRE